MAMIPEDITEMTNTQLLALVISLVGNTPQADGYRITATRAAVESIWTQHHGHSSVSGATFDPIKDEFWFSVGYFEEPDLA